MYTAPTIPCCREYVCPVEPAVRDRDDGAVQVVRIFNITEHAGTVFPPDVAGTVDVRVHDASC